MRFTQDPRYTQCKYENGSILTTCKFLLYLIVQFSDNNVTSLSLSLLPENDDSSELITNSID